MQKHDLCMIRNCKYNNGLGTCYIENGVPYQTLEDIQLKEDIDRVTSKCNKFILEE